jgi:hypothetical protein
VELHHLAHYGLGTNAVQYDALVLSQTLRVRLESHEERASRRVSSKTEAA